MRRCHLLQLRALMSVSGVLASVTLPACVTTRYDALNVGVAEPTVAPTGASGWSAGGGAWSGGEAQWGAGGGMWSGGGGWWSGGGGSWSGSSGLWGAGGGQWSGGGGWWSGGGGEWSGGGGEWSGGGGSWSGGGGWWSGGGGLWSGGGGSWSGGGGNWSGGGGLWSGGGGNWSGGGGLWSGGFATSFPFVGWSYARHWNFRGVPAPAGYDPTNPPNVSGTQDTAACANNQVRLGGFAYPVDADGWGSAIALGYHAKLCLPTPGGGGLTMNSTVQTPTIAIAGGYALKADLSNAANDAFAIKSMVGFGQANIAHQYSGALCASIGSLAAAKRSCAVGIAFTDVNTKVNGTPTQRGAVVPAAQNNSVSFRTPFGQADGYGLYGDAPQEVQSYANRALLKHASLSVPTSATSVPDWNATNNAASFSFTGNDFAPETLSASPDAQKLVDDANRSVGATSSPAVNTLNMIPKDYGQTLLSDAQQSVAQSKGQLYLLSLHSLAMQQNPLFGSGGGRWYFTNSASRPLLEPSSVFQSSTYLLTGRLSGQTSSSSLTGSLISGLELAYADWRAEPSSGTLYIDKAGQYPAAIASDADREARLAAALDVPHPDTTVGLGYSHRCAITRSGGVQCWGSNTQGQLGDGTIVDRTTPVSVVGLSGKVRSLAGGTLHTCAVLESGAVQCWGYNLDGQLGVTTPLVCTHPVFGTGTCSYTPVTVVGLAGKVTSIVAGQWHNCALLESGQVQCWGNNHYGALGDGSTAKRVQPKYVTGLTGKATSLASGGFHVCARLESGKVQCWGHNGYGHLGDGTTTNRLTPVYTLGLSGKVASLAAGYGHTCALLQSGAVECWGLNSSYQAAPTSAKTSAGGPCNTSAKAVTGFAGKVTSVVASESHNCALLQGGTVQCWGSNQFNQLGGPTSQRCTVNNTPCSSTPVTFPGLQGDKVLSLHSQAQGLTTCLRTITGSVKCWDHTGLKEFSTATNAGRVTSQGSVLVHRESSEGAISGHVTPIPWSMTKTSTGTQALMVTYDPLAAAAAVFIEQYQAHVNACKATSGESVTEDQQRQSQYLWACSNATGKTNYLAGMLTMLKGARAYLFGTSGAAYGCVQAGATGDGTTCATTQIYANAHLPYTAVVPAYTSWDPTYLSEMQSAVSDYRTRLLASNGSRLEKTLQLMGVRSFMTDDAIVSSRVQRLASYGTQTNGGVTYDQLNCIDKEGFAAQGAQASCGDGVCAVGQESAASCPIDCSSAGLTNLAVGKTATQRDTNHGAEASRAVDGNIDGKFSNGSVTHTLTMSGSWWQVDLGAVSSVNYITIWNRTDCCSSRLTNFDVQTSTDGSTWTSHVVPGTASTTTNVPIGDSARYVRVVINSNNVLSLAEVQVWGTAAP